MLSSFIMAVGILYIHTSSQEASLRRRKGILFMVLRDQIPLPLLIGPPPNNLSFRLQIILNYLLEAEEYVRGQRYLERGPYKKRNFEWEMELLLNGPEDEFKADVG